MRTWPAAIASWIFLFAISAKSIRESLYCVALGALVRTTRRAYVCMVARSSLAPNAASASGAERVGVRCSRRCASKARRRAAVDYTALLSAREKVMGEVIGNRENGRLLKIIHCSEVGDTGFEEDAGAAGSTASTDSGERRGVAAPDSAPDDPPKSDGQSCGLSGKSRFLSSLGGGVGLDMADFGLGGCS